MIKNILREPLVHFILLSCLFFIINAALNPQETQSSQIITVTQGRIEQLKKSFEKTWKTTPSQQELDKLINSYVLDKIYAREAQALGLDENDTVIQRRLRQKMEFILQDASALQTPSDGELKGFYRNNSESYRDNNRYSFTQIYLTNDRPDVELQQLLNQQQDRVKQGLKPQGDNSLLPKVMTLATTFQIDRHFGKGFSVLLDAMPLNQWQSPFKSGLGLHFIKLEERIVGEIVNFDDIKSEVLKKWHNENSLALKKQYEAELLEQYKIEFVTSSSKQNKG